MANNKKYKQGDIVLVPFPFTDLTSKKTRPALVVCKNCSKEDLVVIAITSRKFKFAVKFTDSDLSVGRVPVTSYIRADKVVTLHRALIKRTVAKLNSKKLKETIQLFKNQF